MKKSHSENTVGPWARQKLDGLESYLNAYTTALSKQRFRLVFIDAFAGAGKSRVREAWSGLDESEIQLFEDETIAQGEEEFIEGSPRRALNIRRPFHSYHFFDADAARAELLRDLREEFGNREIDVRVGDANHLVQALAPTLKPRQIKGIAFLDPYGPHLHWRTLEALAATKNVEVIINFPLAMAINRLITRSGDIPDNWRRSLNACFGSDEWYRICYREQGDLFGKSFITKVDDAAARPLVYYAGRLETCSAMLRRPALYGIPVGCRSTTSSGPGPIRSAIGSRPTYLSKGKKCDGQRGPRGIGRRRSGRCRS